MYNCLLIHLCGWTHRQRPSIMPSTSTTPVRRQWRTQSVGGVQLKLLPKLQGLLWGAASWPLQGASGAWGPITNPWNIYAELRPKTTACCTYHTFRTWDANAIEALLAFATIAQLTQLSNEERVIIDTRIRIDLPRAARVSVARPQREQAAKGGLSCGKASLVGPFHGPRTTGWKLVEC